MVAVDPFALVGAALPATHAESRIPGDVFFQGDTLDAGTFTADASNRAEALDRALTAARAYILKTTKAQNRIIQRIRNSRGSAMTPGRRAALAWLARHPVRYEAVYVAIDPPDSALTGSLRAGLIGLGLALLVAAWITTSAIGTGLAVALATLLGAGLAGVAAAGPTGVYLGLFAALLFLATYVYVRNGHEHALRVVLVALIVFTPLRGALLGLEADIALPQSLLMVNLVQPCLVAASALATLVRLRGLPQTLPRSLLVGWALIAAAAALDLATQSVGLKVYAIGLGQYLTYPTLALLAWLALRREDVGRVPRLLIGMALIVSASIFLEAAGLVHFVEAADPHAAGTTARYGGSTGSYLHAGIFLGVAIPLAIGQLLAARSPGQRLLWAASVMTSLAALSLTYGRGGFLIAGLGALVILVGSPRRDQVRVIAAGSAALVLAAGAYGLVGGNPATLASRVASSVNWSSDRGNRLRVASMKQTLNRFRRAPAPQKALGQGLAATGNAGKLVSLRPTATESYPLKLLVEVGVVGLLLIGGFLVWAAVAFVRLARGAANRPELIAVGGAGLALSIYSLVFQTLEVQLIALTWWMLLVIALKQEAGGSGERI